MLRALIRFVDLIVVGLVVGAMFGIWLGYDPAGLSASAYIEVQQQAIRALNTSMPVLGAVCIVLTSALVLLERGDRTGRYILIGATLCLLAAGLVTRFQNQPINAVVMTWSAQSPPADWMQLRDQWWRWHVFRTVAGVAGFVFLAWAVLRGRRAS